MWKAFPCYDIMTWSLSVFSSSVRKNMNLVLIPVWISIHMPINTLRPRQNGCLFADEIFKCIFFNENVWISITISLKFVPKVRINNIPALVQIMAWRRLGDKPLSETMMVTLLMHICVTRPQWVKLWDEITYPFPNTYSCTIEVWESVSNSILHFIIDVITYPFWDYS